MLKSFNSGLMVLYISRASAASKLPVLKDIDYDNMAKIALFIPLVLGLFILSSIALSDSMSSCSFAGFVKLNGVDVPDGTVITATVEGDEYTTTTPTGYGASTYAILIQTPSGKYYYEGTQVSFKIDNFATDQSGTWEPGHNIRLDLTASTPGIPAASPNTWLIFALVIACIAEVSVVGSVVYITMRHWNI